jgi:DNA-binding transcriptional regulator PaaX
MRGIWVPSTLLNGSLGPAEALLAGYIGGWADGCFASNQRISEDIGISEHYVQMLISRLVKRGVIQRMGCHRSRKMRLSKKYLTDTIVSVR